MKKIVLGSMFILLLSAMVAVPLVKAEEGRSNVKEVKKIESLEKRINRLDDAFENFHAEEGNAGRAVIVRENGDFRIRGAVVNSVAASTSMINVSFYGFSRDVNVAGAKLIGAGKQIQLSDFRAGDVLTASGNFNEATRVITVKEIHNLSYAKRGFSDDIQRRIDELLRLIDALRAKLNASNN